MANYQSLETELRQVLQQPGLTFDASLALDSGPLPPASVEITINPTARRAHLHLSYPGLAEEDLYAAWTGAEITWHRRSRNLSGKTLKLVELQLQLDGLTCGPDRKKDYFYSAENPRIYGIMTIPVYLKRTQEMAKSGEFDTLAGNRWADPGVVSDRVGASPYQPFPAVLLANYEAAAGLVHGTLTQKIFYHNYLFSHSEAGIRWEMFSSCKDIPCRDWLPDEVLDDRWYLGVTADAADIRKIFDGYVACLKPVLSTAYGATPINRHTAVWGSWNDGIFRDIDQERLFKMADFLREQLPTVEWMQIDDGYGTHYDVGDCANGMSVPYEGAAGVDAKKFPDGFKAYTDGVRQRGLRPALWIGGIVPVGTPLEKDHPDWFIDYSYRITAGRVLDVSKPEVREYMSKALDFFFTQGGFEGMKHDFWSYAFEDSHPLLAGHERTGYEWRIWWLQEIRRRLPADGYLQTGCDIVMGNPFLGEYFTNYRYGIDIGNGNWDYILTNFLWGTACFATHTGSLFVPNSDSIGIFPGLSDGEAQTCINYCLISRSMVEVAGWLYQHPDHPRLRWVKKSLCCPNNGQDVYFADYDYRDNQSKGPAIWYLRTPHFSLLENDPLLPLRTVAVFNLGDVPQAFTLTAAKLGLPSGRYTITDVWSLESGDMKAFQGFTIPGRSSRLFAVSPASAKPRILDADIKITAAASQRKSLTLEIAHRGELDLVLSFEPVAAKLNGQPLAVTIAQGCGNWRLKAVLAEPGTLEVSW